MIFDDDEYKKWVEQHNYITFALGFAVGSLHDLANVLESTAMQDQETRKAVAAGLRKDLDYLFKLIDPIFYPEAEKSKPAAPPAEPDLLG